MSVIHASSAFQPADFLTKAIAQDSFEFHRNFAMNILVKIFGVLFGLSLIYLGMEGGV